MQPVSQGMTRGQLVEMVVQDMARHQAYWDMKEWLDRHYTKAQLEQLAQERGLDIPPNGMKGQITHALAYAVFPYADNLSILAPEGVYLGHLLHTYTDITVYQVKAFQHTVKEDIHE